jgi:hypothetical protein
MQSQPVPVNTIQRLVCQQPIVPETLEYIAFIGQSNYYLFQLKGMALNTLKNFKLRFIRQWIFRGPEKCCCWRWGRLASDRAAHVF